MEMTAGGTGSAHAKEMARKTMERSNLYGFLAAVYREEPTAALLLELKSPEFRNALSEAGVALGRDLLERPEKELLLDLAVEYTRLFIGPGKHISPHEAAQLEGSLWGEATGSVARFIEGSGFQLKPEHRGMPDHIGVELEFMREVTKREAEAWESGDRDRVAECVAIERQFLDDHLSRWVPGFCAKVAEQAELAFYKEMAALTKDFIEAEREEMERRAGEAGGSP